MKNLFVIAVILMAACIAVADVSFAVKNVTAQQRYPWNGKVDVDFLLESSDANVEYKVSLECTDHGGNTNIVLTTLKYSDKGAAATEFTLKGGQHRITWDGDVDCPNMKLPSISFAVFAKLIGAEDTATYLVIDLSGGSSASSYPVTYLTGAPSGGWTDEYKSTKLVLRRCPAGSDPLGRYALTKDFFAGVFEVTQKQWTLVMGSNPSKSRGIGDTYPVYYVSYNDIRGSSLGANWPSSSSVDATSFIGKLRSKTGLSELDLPTEAQWEYACRAGSTTTYNLGDDESALAAAGWYSSNSSSTTHPVGQKTANAWCLYDMHGNVYEWCLDWCSYSGCLSGSNPTGAASGSARILRGGSWNFGAGLCSSSYRDFNYYSPSDTSPWVGFRIFRTLP